MFGDTIQAEFVTLEQNKQIVMKWKFKDWATFADVVVDFNQAGSSSVDITVSFKEIPEYDSFGGFVHLESIQNGWR